MTQSEYLIFVYAIRLCSCHLIIDFVRNIHSGIHTDGCDVCALVCLKRENINGCENSVYYDLEGNENVLDSFVLKEKNVLYWKDNKVYHYVNPASLINEDKDGICCVNNLRCK